MRTAQKQRAKPATFGSVLDENNGFGPGFDFARVFLAFNVLGWHSVLVAQGTYGSALEGAGWILNYSVLPMFFGLSGFLVAGSAQRLDIRNFFINRGLRIFPALIVEILLSAVVLGALYTTLPLAKYFTSGAFFTYFENIVGLVRLQLPGVFLHNPNDNVVNASIWTVPYEMACYGVMGALIVSGVVKKGWTLAASAASLACCSQSSRCAICSSMWLKPRPNWSSSRISLTPARTL